MIKYEEPIIQFMAALTILLGILGGKEPNWLIIFSCIVFVLLFISGMAHVDLIRRSDNEAETPEEM
jgi:hypothetical protein